MAASRKMPILVVDHNAAMRRVTKSILKQLSFANTSEVDTAENAWKFLEREQVELLICEWNLPLMSGLEFLRKIRSSEEFSDLKFIIISNEAQQENIVQAILSKVSAYIVRPFSAEILGKKIDSLFDSKEEAAQTQAQAQAAILGVLRPASATAAAPVSEIEDIIANRKLLTYFQPMISFKSKSIVGFEALSRGYRESPGDVIGPGALFGMAEEAGLVQELDAACRAKALRDFQPIYKRNPGLILGLNIHSHYIANGIDVLPDMDGMLEETGIAPSSLVLDIHESEVSSLAGLSGFVSAQKERGFAISFDNIGDGPINFEHIADLKPSLLKIDKSLITSMDRDYYKQETIKTLINLANKVGATAVAIGVEREDEVLTLLKFGIHTLQGFYFGLPSKDRSNIVEHFSRQISHIMSRFNEHALKKIAATREKYEKIQGNINDVLKSLTGAARDGFDPLLRACLAANNTFDSVFLLDSAGVQITDTITQLKDVSKISQPISPITSKGHDHSLRDYYLHIKAGYPRFVTDTYVSPLSGMLCKTMSNAFTAQDGEKYILCLEAHIDS